MATSDERRKVAERLRTDFASFASAPGESALTYPVRCIYALCRLVGAEESDWVTINRRLADLIDPTCRKVIPNEMEGYVFCSKCGAEIGEYSVPNYCPNCGARVVMGDE